MLYWTRLEKPAYTYVAVGVRRTEYRVQPDYRRNGYNLTLDGVFAEDHDGQPQCWRLLKDVKKAAASFEPPEDLKIDAGIKPLPPTKQEVQASRGLSLTELLQSVHFSKVAEVLARADRLQWVTCTICSTRYLYDKTDRQWGECPLIDSHLGRVDSELIERARVNHWSPERKRRALYHARKKYAPQTLHQYKFSRG